jgi:hypothetical protein
MAQDNGVSRRELLGKAGAAGLAAMGVALLPAAAEAGLGDYPALAKGHDRLLDAKKVLEKGDNGFGGHRAKAIKLIDEALDEIKAAVRFADGK